MSKEEYGKYDKDKKHRNRDEDDEDGEEGGGIIDSILGFIGKIFGK